MSEPYQHPYEPISSRITRDDGKVQKGRMHKKRHDGIKYGLGEKEMKNIRVERKNRRGQVTHVNGIPVNTNVQTDADTHAYAEGHVTEFTHLMNEEVIEAAYEIDPTFEAESIGMEISPDLHHVASMYIEGDVSEEDFSEYMDLVEQDFADQTSDSNVF